jgi:hypothetical protein
MIKDNHVGVMRRYSAISDLAPRGSVLKYSVNVMPTIVLKLFVKATHPAALILC